ncbi:hypothetical protein [Streptosporangium roseum]|uniref:Uncharacterized protein n=1 Tax=Streptosporangium roseum (strain ATCC 12428 / DSM 43021 / JCM 3005 / KCTC 9067 / NCIMB 10171 / NRRL 2505 / NI 9100) TaxID=479432 RepID=D2AZB1_STRRD|nr:hypothetical protein [Streptosporangium roseum]ACZ83296.1 hypothetical protein Sros_0262 [Streptosporangium roseum DSM 43021]
MGVDAERDGRIGVAGPGGDDMDGGAGQERRRGVDVAKVVAIPKLTERMVRICTLLKA